MNKIKVVNKGYTLSVISWENDGDNYRTKSKTYDTKEKAVKIAKLCKELFVSCNNGNGGIGNINEDDEEEANETILEWLENNPTFFENQENLDEEGLINDIMEINYNLMGGSEYYYSRVFQSASITYSPEDVYLEEIKF